MTTWRALFEHASEYDASVADVRSVLDDRRSERREHQSNDSTEAADE